jgi:hypothetical protein
MASDRPEVDIRTGFSATSVTFEVKVTNPGTFSLWSMQLRPRPVPPSAVVDRPSHAIPLLRPKRTRRVVFRLRPPIGHQVVALDVGVEWEDDAGDTRSRTEVSSRPVELVLPEMSPPRGGMERWRAGLSGGAAVELRMRQPATPLEMVDALERAMADAPGEFDVHREEGPRGPTGRVWVRAEGARGRRAGLMVDVTPDPKVGGCRVLVNASANSEEVLALFYHACLPALAEAAPGIEDVVPHTLSEAA